MITQHIRGLVNMKAPSNGCVLTIGNFDGVHLGHQALLTKVSEYAKKAQLTAVVMTFNPLPKEFFDQASTLPRLMNWREKFTAIAKYQIDQLVTLRFNQQFAQLTADEFIKKILVEKLAVKHIIIGDDFRFGKGRLGDFAALQAAGQLYGFTIEKMPTLLLNNERVSSTLVRSALAAGDLELVSQLLGHTYTLQGKVAHGDKRGRTIGFPTANIYLHRASTPVKGVYVVQMHGIENKALQGVANIGNRPTLGGTREVLEVHLFDFNQDIYGRQVTVELLKKIRDEQRFDSFDLLKQQIQQDTAVARNYFK